MKNMVNPNWISSYGQLCIDPPPIAFAKNYYTEEHHTNIIKVKIQRNLMSATLETYKLKMKIFESGQPEELIALLKNFKKSIDRTRTNTISRPVNYLCTIIRGEALR